MSTGVYAIRNLRNGRGYVGQSCRVESRLLSHLRALRRGTHINRHLQATFRKYGEGAFEFRTVVICEPFELTRYEQGLVNVRGHYNICKKCVTSSLGVTRTAETRARMSIALHGHTVTAESRARMSIAHRGRTHTAETRAWMSNTRHGRIFGPETRTRLSVALRGHTVTAESRARMSIAHRGHTHTAETRARISSAMRGRTLGPETRAKLSVACKTWRAAKKRTQK